MDKILSMRNILSQLHVFDTKAINSVSMLAPVILKVTHAAVMAAVRRFSRKYKLWKFPPVTLIPVPFDPN